ncbi:cAMP-specific 3',5'-cyclic phosphodiesterase [Elysia marginata]|uniref:cAMP-specific 3',5'-cyclic phosphodiesterase n=1 Tax=Elysia marginata TaxID=1093978 RepID=A0AAV4GA66_9GAST|nr:cAMP-specific 3',5'-cyclic phosphodiesterase [Elysia marginata]
MPVRLSALHSLCPAKIALKCADISNPCREWKVSQRWSRRVCNEFFLQGDTERTLQIPVLPLCDRIGNTVANIQNGFMQFVAQPLFKAWHQFMQTPLTAKMLDHLTSNQASWQAIMSGVGVRKKTCRIYDNTGTVDAGDDDNDSCDSDVDYEFLADENEEEELEHVGEERMDIMDMVKEGEEVEQPMEIKSSIADEVPGVKTVTLVLPPEVAEEEEESKGEAADVVHNDVNLLYQYQPELEESCGLGPVASAPRCLSPVSERGEMGSSEIPADLDPLHSSGFNSSFNGRRFSVPAIVPVRKDLSFYLGLRRDSAGPSPSSSTGSFTSSTNLCSYSAFSRRQSLPTTALYFHGSNQASAGGATDISSVSPRSLSVDALLARPKITSLSPGGFGEVVLSGRGFQNIGNVHGNPTSSARVEGDSSCSSTPSQPDQVVVGSGAKDSGGLTPLFNQTLLLLHGSDMTRFTSNPTVRRASYEPGLAEHTRQGTNCPNLNKDIDATGSGYSSVRRLTLPMAQIPSASGSHLQKDHNQERRYRKHQQNQDKHSLHPPRVGLAASWPTLSTKRKTTNGATTSTPKKTPEKIDKPVHKPNHIMDTCLPVASSPSFVSPASMCNKSAKERDGHLDVSQSQQALNADGTTRPSSDSFHTLPTPSASQLSQPVTARSGEDVDPDSQFQTYDRHMTNPQCLSQTSSASSSAQDNNHVPRPQ